MTSAARVLLVSRPYIVTANRGKLAALGRLATLTVLVPLRWRDPLGVRHLEPGGDDSYQLIGRRAYFDGHALRHFYGPAAAWQLLRATRPELVHVEEEPGSLALFEFAALKPLFGYRLSFFTWENILRPAPMPVVERFNLRRADGAIAGNREAQEVLRQKRFAGPLAVVPQLGVELPEDANSETLRNELGLIQPTIGYVGRLVPEKGIAVLLEAVARLGGDCQVLLIGRGAWRERLEELARELGVERRLVMVDVVPHDQVPAYLRCLDAFVLPSLTTPQWKEQFGHVLIEAMACGVPVVGSASGAIPEVIGDAGLLFREGDAEELAGKLAQLLASPELRAGLARRGRERVMALYTDQRIAERMAAFWREICP
jgi:glycosyltransferase involved in cell wall biosynthesis